MFKQNKEKLELRLSKLEKNLKGIGGIVGYHDPDSYIWGLIGEDSIDKRVKRLENNIADLDRNVRDIKNTLLQAGIIKQINNDEPTLIIKSTSLFGYESKNEYGVVNPVKKGKTRG